MVAFFILLSVAGFTCLVLHLAGVGGRRLEILTMTLGAILCALAFWATLSPTMALAIGVATLLGWLIYRAA